jgi:threonine dehydratase
MTVQTTVSLLPNLEQIRAAAREIAAVMPPTPQYTWPLLDAHAGREVWVKHENHTRLGAFKIRGGIIYFNRLRERGDIRGAICATRGNHGQSVAFNGARTNIPVTIVVPHGNSPEKNAAMRALGAELIEHGNDFQDALDHARRLARERSLHFVPSYAPELVQGVATLSLELFEHAPRLDAHYVPVGMGSGLAGALAARDALGINTEVVAVIAEGAPAIALSLAAKRVIEAPVDTLADGMACRLPNAEALATFIAHDVRCVRVTDEEIAHAMRLYFTLTHNVAEGAGAASLAAALKDAAPARPRVGVVLSGANVDCAAYARILTVQTTPARSGAQRETPAQRFVQQRAADEQDAQAERLPNSGGGAEREADAVVQKDHDDAGEQNA